MGRIGRYCEITLKNVCNEISLRISLCRWSSLKGISTSLREKIFSSLAERNKRIVRSRRERAYSLIRVGFERREKFSLEAGRKEMALCVCSQACNARVKKRRRKKTRSHALILIPRRRRWRGTASRYSHTDDVTCCVRCTHVGKAPGKRTFSR